MARQSSDTILNSLRGRILVAVGALIVFNCILGFAAYLLVSLLKLDSVLAIVAAVSSITAVTAVFGWWISRELLTPIESLSLLARSLERSPTASLPRSTGASETDELLHSLHRNSQQLQNLISLMDDVANGKTDAAMAPMANPDRLSLSFQKLVSKVVESIKAKQQLDALQSSLNRLKSDIAGIRAGDLNIEFRGDLWQTGEIADTFKYLLLRLSSLVAHISVNGTGFRENAEEAMQSMRKLSESEAFRVERIRKSATSNGEFLERLTKLAGQLEMAVSGANLTLSEKLFKSDAPVAAATRIRDHAYSARRSVEQLNHCVAAVDQAARRTEELARRSSLIALNATISDAGRGSGAGLSDEIDLLAQRAEALKRDISSISDSLSADLTNLDTSLSAIASEISPVSESVVAAVNAVSEFARYLDQVDQVHTDLEVLGGNVASDGAAASEILSADDDGDGLDELKRASQNIESIFILAERFKDAISDYQASPRIPIDSPASRVSQLAGGVDASANEQI